MDVNTFNAPSLTPARKKYAIIVAAVVVIIAIIGIISLLVLRPRDIKQAALPAPVLDRLAGGAAISLNEDYRNPFDQESQYVNPFSEFKSPFHSLQ